jgi:hypothetical protein
MKLKVLKLNMRRRCGFNLIYRIAYGLDYNVEGVVLDVNIFMPDEEPSGGMPPFLSIILL